MTTVDFDALWDYNRPAETEQRFLDVLQTTDDENTSLQLLTQIARARGLQRQFDAAHQTLDTVHAAGSSEPIVTVRYLLERGRVYNSSRQPEKALPLFEQAYALACQHGLDAYAIDAAHMVAIVETSQAALDWNLRALDIAEKSPDEKAQRWRGSLYNNLGWTYHDQGEYEKALALFEKALAWREAQSQPDEIRIARWCVGRVLRSLNRLDEALVLQRALEQDPDHDGYVEEEIAECLLAAGEAEAAAPYFARAFAALSHDAWLAANEPARLERLRTLGGER